MGLLARASKEAQAGAFGSPKTEVRLSEGSALPPLFDAVEVAALRSRLPGKEDILAIKCAASRKGSDDEPMAVLGHRLKVALGPTSKIYRKAYLLFAFASPRGDWDPPIFKLQLGLSLGRRLEGKTTQDCSFDVVRLVRNSASFDRELAQFIEA